MSEGRNRRRLLLALPLALVAALLAAPAAKAGLLFPEAGGSPNADSIKTLYIMVFILALFIFVGVEATLLWALFKFKAKKGRTAAQIHGNTKLEIGWTVGAFVILIFITVFTFIQLPSIKNPPRSLIDENGNPVANVENVQYAATNQSAPDGPSMTIEVNGQQYVWRYLYPGNDRLLTYTDMVVPVGMTVLLDITADDVAHSWWIPKLGGKMDAVPGYTNKLWFRIPPDAIPEGESQVVYTGQCAELCGRNHANMYGRVIGMRMEDYKRWYAEKVQQVKTAETNVTEQQKQLNEQQSAGGEN
ncbi:cytochrome c oxidase subunit II [Solirubrobacter sp. CPCC 204708]|uniref:Cytochrome c oxidase subunit 2 n=1 Tax=Solirubrobacter deserti TaxID=2282478 RepID=A0ABT4RID9_9ACTN|nr:cytochrome c oxidase subunit II [Solirubrobacter deserti]MBE2320305.1 cytochrome c oxidase subunit II [Solirubrobacter deserti]MDA0138309.1 cytochrome c oxidase subunit II [Solirubrobacter deserti]